MALWPFEQLIEVINGRRALRTTLSGHTTSVSDRRDVFTDTKTVTAMSSAFLRPVQATLTPPFLVIVQISNTEGNGTHKAKLIWRRRQSSLGSQAVGSAVEILTSSTSTPRAFLVGEDMVRAQGFDLQVFNESDADFDVTVDLVYWRSHIREGS